MPLSCRSGSTDGLLAARSAQVPLPDAAQRRDVLRVTLEKYRLECGHEAPLSAELLASVTAAPAAASDAAAGNGSGEDPLSRVAGRAQGFTGSDLVQLCSEAVRQPMREAMDATEGAASFSGETSVRPLELRCSSCTAVMGICV